MLLTSVDAGGGAKIVSVNKAGVLDPDWLQAFAVAVATPATRLLQGALTVSPLDRIALRHDLAITATDAVSIRLDGWETTDQGKSGRCWIFAGLNLFRPTAAAAMGVLNFQFSQSFVMFWDKLERANLQLEAFRETAHLPIDDRTVAFLLDNLANDGGQWQMFVALVRKHGLVPRSLMPETPSSRDTGPMNARLRTVLRKAALDIRRFAADPSRVAEIKRDALAGAYRILSLHLGTPPERFTWQWTDDAKGFHRDPETDPRTFAAKYVTLPIDDYVCLVNDPRAERQYGDLLTVRYLGNVVEAPPVAYVNVDVATMRKAVRDTLDRGEPVWFGCDTDKMVNDRLGVWDSDLYDYDTLYGTSARMTKAERVLSHESRMTHAMIFTGMDLADDDTTRWRVENSWGSGKGQKGFYLMNDNWFHDYVFEVAVRRDLLPENLRKADGGTPIVLEPWDPMGALAR